VPVVAPTSLANVTSGVPTADATTPLVKLAGHVKSGRGDTASVTRRKKAYQPSRRRSSNPDLKQKPAYI